MPLAPGGLVYYPKPEGTYMRAARFGAAAHLNFGASTIRLQDNNGGLQVRHKAGDLIPALPIEGTFAPNIGDILEHWATGRLASAEHRVSNS